MNRFQIYIIRYLPDRISACTIFFLSSSQKFEYAKTSIDIYIGFGNKQKTEIHPPLTMNRSNRSNDRCMLRSGKRKTEIHAAPIINRNQSESGKEDHRSLYSPRVECCLIAILRVNSRRFFYV